MESEQNSAKQNSQNVEQLPIQPVVEQKKSNFLSSKWLKIGAVVLALLVLLGGTFVLGGKLMSKPTQSPIPTPVVSEPTPTPDPTADWKTAITSKYSIKFPPGWYLESKTETYLRIQNYNPIGAPGREYDPILDKGWFTIQISKEQDTANNVNELQTVIQKLDTQSAAAGFTKKSTTDEIVNINGMQGVSRISIKNPTEPAITYLLDGNGGVYSITPGLDLAAGQNYNDILSTFKFTNLKSSENCKSDSDCSDGKKCQQVGPIVVGQPRTTMCIGKGEAAPL